MTSNKPLSLPSSWSGLAISPKTGKPYQKHTKKQSLAVRRNFALMQLAGMQSQIYMVYNCLSQERSKARVSIKLAAIHKHLDEIKDIVKSDYEQWKLAELEAAKKLLEKGGA
jgi:hypothetical protein